MKNTFTPAPWAWQRFGDTYMLTAQHGLREIIIGAIKHPTMNYPIPAMNDQEHHIITGVDPEHPNAKAIANARLFFDVIRKCQDHLATWIVPDSEISDKAVLGDLLCVLDDQELVKLMRSIDPTM